VRDFIREDVLEEIETARNMAYNWSAAGVRFEDFPRSHQEIPSLTVTSPVVRCRHFVSLYRR